jgi:hypothetical protein
MKRESLVRFPVSQRVQMNFILSHNVDILYLSCIVKNLKTTALLSEKGRNKRRSNRLGLCPLLRLRLHCCRFLPSLNMKQELQKGCTRLAAASNKIYQLLAHGRWFSSGTPASSTTKTDRHDITEILLKVTLNTKILK